MGTGQNLTMATLPTIGLVQRVHFRRETHYRRAQVELGFDGAAALMVWYGGINTCGIYKKFYTCRDNHTTTEVSQWGIKNP